MGLCAAWHGYWRYVLIVLIILGASSTALIACSGGGVITKPRQVLIFPNVGIQDVSTLDPTQGPDTNSMLAVDMLFSGLVRFDQDLHVLPDQASSWDISSDQKTYTFHLRKGITFSDGSPVTAQTYVYTLTHALLPQVNSPVASLFERPILGAQEVLSGKTKSLSGVKALNHQTLRITLLKPTVYFLEMLTNEIYFPLPQKIIDRYGQTNWGQHAVNNGVGTGPFMLTEWDHNTKMVFVPNPHYYGVKTKLSEVDMIFVNDPATALKVYRVGRYSFVWNVAPSDLTYVKSQPGFTSSPQLQTDLLFFNQTMPPFDNVKVRQAFAYAIDKMSLVHNTLHDSAIVAPTILPPSMLGYQPDYQGIPYDTNQAKSLLQSVYPDVNTVPPITFSYPSSEITQNEATTLQKMWLKGLNIQVKLRSVEPDAYNDEVNKHAIQFGFTQWMADFPDPYDCLTQNLLSTSSGSDGHWNNPTFDQTVIQAEQLSGDARIALYHQAEQIAITDVGWLPLDHQSIAAIIPSTVHGVSVNAGGLFFGDWSGVSVSQH